MSRTRRFLLAFALGYASQWLPRPCAAELPRAVLPDAVLDLRTRRGLEIVQGQWRYSDTHIHEIPHRAVGADLKASGPTNRTFDFSPAAQAPDFDDSRWPVIAPESLEQRRGNGRLSFNWYRLHLTLPERVGAMDVRGSTVVLELVLDDYAEVWVDGRLERVLGQGGGPVVAGWNAPNRVVLTRDATPGRQFHIAVFGINGPISTHPDTYIWMRSATLDFHEPGRLARAEVVQLEIDRRDPALDAILDPDAKLERIAGGFAFTEGPVWVPEGEGYLLFSDPNNNRVYRLTPDGDVSIYLPKSGYTGEDMGTYRQPGSNGLTLDSQGRLTLCQHGNRRVVRIEPNGVVTVVADRYQGKRLNSPNDLVYRSDGTLYFTDPPFGLPKFHEDLRREQPHFGVYSVRDGTVRLESTAFTGPNGLAFSPDERFLYVGNWDDTRKLVFRHPVQPDGRLGPGELFHDLTAAPGGDAIDGIKVDARGNVFVSGPGGLWILSPEGRHLGTLRGPEHPHNLAFGGPDGRTLFLAAQTGIYRLRTKVCGAATLPQGDYSQAGRGSSAKLR